VLSILEALPLADVTVLLDEDGELIQVARDLALQELVRNLTALDDRTPAATSRFGLREMQHAG
jgi:hypothetical protein